MLRVHAVVVPNLKLPHSSLKHLHYAHSHTIRIKIYILINILTPLGVKVVTQC